MQDEVEAAALAALARDDPDEALRVLMDGYGARIYRFCQRMLQDPDLVDDVHQLSFVQAHRDLHRFQGRSSLSSWLFGIARHRCLDAHRSRRRQQSRFEPLDESAASKAPTEGVEDLVLHRSLSDALSVCLAKLSPKIRSAVLLRFREGLSYPEMSDAFEERSATLRLRVARALPALRRCLEGLGVAL